MPGIRLDIIMKAAENGRDLDQDPAIDIIDDDLEVAAEMTATMIEETTIVDPVEKIPVIMVEIEIATIMWEAVAAVIDVDMKKMKVRSRCRPCCRSRSGLES